MQHCNKILDSVITHATNEFEYGQLDCAIFAGEVAKDLYGIDIVDKFKSKYSNIKEALEYLKKNDYTDLVDAVSKELKQESVSISELEDGDVVAIRSKYKKESMLGYALGISYKGYALLIREEGNKIAKIPLEACVCGWKLNV